MRLFLHCLALCAVVFSNRITAHRQAPISLRHVRDLSNPSDEDLLAETMEIDRQIERQRNKKRVYRRGTVGKLLEDQIKDSEFKHSNFSIEDDYSDFDDKDIANRGQTTDSLNTVTFSPSKGEDGRKKLTDTEVAIGKKGWKLQDGDTARQQHVEHRVAIPVQRPLRTGFYFQHYPWHLLPKAYRMRPTFSYVYPPQYQNAKWAFPSQLPQHYDPYAIYTQTKNARDNQNSYFQSAYGYGGYSGYGQQRGYGSSFDTEDFNHDDDEEDEEKDARSGEVELSKKEDPLDDLDLETLEKIDKMDREEHKFVVRAKALRARAVKV